MNYELHVVKGRSATTALKLAEGQTSIGRHNACTIRIKSSQVSRRHCEINQNNGKLIVRDLNSSNGTIVNGKRIKGVSILQDGDELTIGGVVLRIVTTGANGAVAPSAPKPAIKPSDTAEIEAIAVEDGDGDAEFEIDLDPDQDDLGFADVIPLDDDNETMPSSKVAGKAGLAPGNAAPPKPAAKPVPPKPAPSKRTEEDDAVDQFLLDLDLDND